MNAASTMTPMPNAPRTSVEPQPRLGPSMTPHSSVERPTIDSTAPTGSSLGADGSLELGTKKKPAMRPKITIGTLTSSTAPHQKCWSRKPPVTGPSPTPMPDTPAHTPMARPRSRGSVKTLVMIDRVAGMISAPPTPMRLRQLMSALGSLDVAASAEPMPKMARPRASAP